MRLPHVLQKLVPVASFCSGFTLDDSADTAVVCRCEWQISLHALAAQVGLGVNPVQQMCCHVHPLHQKTRPYRRSEGGRSHKGMTVLDGGGGGGWRQAGGRGAGKAQPLWAEHAMCCAAIAFADVLKCSYCSASTQVLVARSCGKTFNLLLEKYGTQPGRQV